MTVGYISSNGHGPSGRSDGARRLLALGYITAVALPVVGFIIGTVIAVRRGTPRSKHGAWIIAISIVACVVWILLLASPVLTSSTNDLT